MTREGPWGLGEWRAAAQSPIRFSRFVLKISSLLVGNLCGELLPGRFRVGRDRLVDLVLASEEYVRGFGQDAVFHQAHA